jgi:hypothetical protein
MQSKLNRGGHKDGESRIIIDLFCLAHKDSGAPIGGSSQKAWPHSENNDAEKKKKNACDLLGLQRHDAALNNTGE